MPNKAIAQKVECLNPNKSGSMKIDKDTHDLFSTAIMQTLKNGKLLTYSQIVEGIYTYFKKHKIKFKGSVEWYAITVKKDMEAKHLIEVISDKGSKLNRLSKKA